QAENGIRGATVTGVQTCALPISTSMAEIATMRTPHRAPELARIATQEKLPITISAMDVDSDASVTEGIGRIVKEGGPVDVLVNKIGRASCRERGAVQVGGDGREA